MKILIVDDNSQNRLLLKMLLEEFNYIVLEASNGEAGLKMAMEELPDLIILDVMMPDVNGRTVAEKLKRNTSTKNIPIILFSAFEDNTTLNTPAEFFLPKPIDINKLVETIKIALKGKQK